MASKLRPRQANGLFYRGETAIGENLHFFIKRSAPNNFQQENFSGGVPTESLFTQDSEYDTVSDVVESKVHQCQQNSDA